MERQQWALPLKFKHKTHHSEKKLFLFLFFVMLGKSTKKSFLDYRLDISSFLVCFMPFFFFYFSSFRFSNGTFIALLQGEKRRLAKNTKIVQLGVSIYP